MSYVDGFHRNRTEDGFFEWAKDNGLKAHVTVTAANNTVIAHMGVDLQQAVEDACKGIVFGSVDYDSSGRRHYHLLLAAPDARRLKDEWTGRRLGLVYVTDPVFDGDDAWRAAVRYVFRKSRNYGDGPDDIIFKSAA